MKFFAIKWSIQLYYLSVQSVGHQQLVTQSTSTSLIRSLIYIPKESLFSIQYALPDAMHQENISVINVFKRHITKGFLVHKARPKTAFVACSQDVMSAVRSFKVFNHYNNVRGCFVVAQFSFSLAHCAEGLYFRFCPFVCCAISVIMLDSYQIIWHLVHTNNEAQKLYNENEYGFSCDSITNLLSLSASANLD